MLRGASPKLIEQSAPSGHQRALRFCNTGLHGVKSIQNLYVCASMWHMALQPQGVNEVGGHSHNIGSFFPGSWMFTKRVNMIPPRAVQENVRDS